VLLQNHVLTYPLTIPYLDHTNSECAEPRKLTNLNIPLKTEEDLEAAAKFFNDTIQWGRLECNART
jgi:hypothetical protein